MTPKRLLIGVIGAAQASERGVQDALRVGQLIAERGATVVCGGLGGIMEAASKGCCEAGGDVVGVLPGASADTANPYVTLPIVTNMGHARNVILVQTADALIAIEGGHGTLSEIAIARKLGKPVVQLNSWLSLEQSRVAVSPEHAIDMVFTALSKGIAHDE